MEFEATQFDDSLLDPAPEEQDNSSVDSNPFEPVDYGAQDQNDNEPDQTEEQPKDSYTEQMDAYMRFLQSRGIRDGKTIVYEDEETGETNEVDFSTLSDDEKFNILDEISKPDLSDDEIQTINFLRQNNATMQDVIAYYQDQAIKEYIEKSGAPTQAYTSDDYSNDELYIADLKGRYPDMTDEELINELETAKENEELFNKKVEVIRNNFKTTEENQKKTQAEAEIKAQKEYQDLFTKTLDNFNYIPMDYKDPDGGAFQVENSEKAAIWDYIFKQDANGMTGLTRDLNDPAKLIEMAHRMLFGAEAMSDLTQHFKQELKKARRTSSQIEKPKSTTTVVKENRNTNRGVDFSDSTSLNPGWGSLL